MTADDRLMLVAVDSDVDPSSTYVYDRESGEAGAPLPGSPGGSLPSTWRTCGRSAMRARRRRDPRVSHGPQGRRARRTSRSSSSRTAAWARTWGFGGFTQFLANRGYAVLMPNFRGSTGFGEEFLNLGNDQWGTGTMQHDITDGVRWLVDQGIADPERVAIMGGSYGTRRWPGSRSHPTTPPASTSWDRRTSSRC